MDKHLELLVSAGHTDVARSICIGEVLDTYLVMHPINPVKDWDLNPHLTIKNVASEVAKRVTAEGFGISEQDVILYWLTMSVYHRMFLPE